MKKILSLTLLFIFLTVPSLYALNKGTYYYTTHWRYSGDTVTLSWNVSEGAYDYELNVIHVETDQLIITARTVNLQIPINLPRMGHYIFKIKAWTQDRSNSSIWSTSILNGKVGEVPGPWWVFAQIPRVVGVIIE